jgi:hypothetical protein
MEIVSVSSSDFLRTLLKAEAVLTLNITVGITVGEFILWLGLVEKLFARQIPTLERWGIHGKIAAAMMMALGSPRSGAALISGAYSDGEITIEEATYGTLSLAFPAYLKRWVGTAALAVSMAGLAGFLFALVLVLRSACRFVWVLAMLVRQKNAFYSPGGEKSRPPQMSAKERFARGFNLLRRSLPWAWFFFALTYMMVPFTDRVFTEHIAGRGAGFFLPAEGWAVAVSSLAHITAALSSAGGAISSGALNVGQAVLALLIGNMAGSVTRTMRQNVGYWIGIFPKDLIPNLLRWHMATTLTLEAGSIFIAACLAWVGSRG